MVEEPGFRQIAVVLAHGAERNPADELSFVVERFEFGGTQFSGGAGGVDFGLPQDFISHPVSDSRKTLLQKQHGLDRGASVAGKEFVDKGGSELAGEDFRGAIAPPGRFFFAVVKKDPAELARIVEDQILTALAQDKMIVLERDGGGFFDAQFSGHSKVNADPAAFGKAKEHLFAVGFGTEQRGPAQGFLEGADIRPAKDFFIGVQVDGKNLLFQAARPLFAIKFDFSQFRHEEQ
jgi:hypothetical protein